MSKPSKLDKTFGKLTICEYIGNGFYKCISRVEKWAEVFKAYGLE